MRKLFFMLPVFLLLATSVQAVNDRALFWQVQSDSATVYLLGSIHYADESFYPLRPEIERAFFNSDHLVVEINIDETKALRYRELIREKGSYQGDRTIRDRAIEPSPANVVQGESGQPYMRVVLNIVQIIKGERAFEGI